MGNGAVILGHNHEGVNTAVTTAMGRGLGAGYETDLSIEAANSMRDLLPGVERVRFANTGTEAAMYALMIARAKTGRDLVAKPEGGYDGWYDPLWVSTWAARDKLGPVTAPASPPGTLGLSSQAKDTIVIPFNNLEATADILYRNRQDLAAVILEPTLIDIGFVPAKQAYLQGLREITGELGIVLIFDELLTGFRLPGNSAAALYQVVPDLSMYGKAIGNGHIVAAVTGKAEFMEGDRVPQFVGTFNSHAVSMAAVGVTMELFAEDQVQTHLAALTGQLRDGINVLSARYGVAAKFQGSGGKFQIYFSETPVVDYRTAQACSADNYAILARELHADGILIAGKYLLHNALSYAHTTTDIQNMLESAERAFAQMAQAER